MIVTKPYVGGWTARRINGSWNAENSQAIGLESSGRLVAGVIYEQYNKASIVCHIAVEGILTPAYLAAIFHYPFVHLGVKKIIAPVAQSNGKSIKFVTKLGFTREATLSDAHPDGDILLFTMSREACRYIGERYGQRIGSLNRTAA